MQGESFEYILKNKGKEPKDWKQATYYRYWMHMAHKHANPAHFGIRTKTHKLIFFYGVDYKNRVKKIDPHNPKGQSGLKTPAGWELYDLVNDPFEMNNVYGKPEYREITKTLKKQLLAQRKQLNEGDEKYPHIQKIIDANWNN